MQNLLKIYQKSIYLQNLLTDVNQNNFAENLIELFKKIFDILNLDISYELFIQYLLDLTHNYKNIFFTNQNIYQYIVLANYFQFDITNDLFNHIVVEYIFKQNIFYNKLFTCNEINQCILNKFEKNKINDNAIQYVFKINKNICNEIKILDASYITQNTLNKCKNVTELYIECNDDIGQVNNLQQLQKLCIINKIKDFGIYNYGISQTFNIKKLYLPNNTKITNINHLQLLEDLDISGNINSIGQHGVSQLLFIKILNAQDNPSINNINHLQLLEYVDISLNCGIDQNGIFKLKFIRYLNAKRNNKIASVEHLQFLENYVK